MRISTKGRYGVLAMYELARKYGDGPVSIKEIASIQNFSDAYMEQLFSSLKKSGLIKSVRGPHGGYILTRHPSEITVGEIIDSLEGPIEVADCTSESNGFVCEKAATCVTKGLWI